MTHAATSGVSHFACQDEAQAIALTRQLMGFLPSNNGEEAPRQACADPVDRSCDALERVGACESEPALRHSRGYLRNRR